MPSTRRLRAALAVIATIAATTGLVAAAAPASAQPDYTIRVGHDGQCLGLDRGHTGNGTAVIQYPCNGSLSQKWSLNAFDNGRLVEFENAKSGTCMDVKHGSGANGTDVVIYTCNYQKDSQAFRLYGRAVRTMTTVPEKCLDIKGASRAPGTRLVQFTCNGHANQQFSFRS